MENRKYNYLKTETDETTNNESAKVYLKEGENPSLVTVYSNGKIKEEPAVRK